jgi:hypothetical protein
MLPIITFSASPHLSLDDLNTVISQQEEFLQAPLVTVGNNGDQTLLSFDQSSNLPGTHARITTGDPPPNIKPLAWGKVFIAGELKDVVALREG